ncbi:Alpha/Beta hydrolase protein [Triangularia verruculosa]|uniref:Alpha/Beta hydrolase protein n=1 Tax=Triangularia verruculosa TaxID=2587418 RepID=A0AAN6XC09_9PEZI|nr:Alpha/Beta hydrolase protein [Triangularia verruculosa]
MLFKTLILLAGTAAVGHAAPSPQGPSADGIPRDVLTQIPSWGPNPTNLQLHLYAPSTLTGKPSIILALHGCFGTGPGHAAMTQGFQTLSSSRNFVVLYPSSINDNNCWDVASLSSLTRDGGGDSTGLATIVRWASTTFNADPKRVFITGSSSGCMMSNVMASAYPDLFSAVSCYSGVPAGCLAGSPGSSPISADQTCANGGIRKTGEEWAAVVKAMAPLPEGKGKGKGKGREWKYPKVQTWHGDNDFFVNYFHNFEEQLKQWGTIHEVEFTRNETSVPVPGYTKMVYGDGTKLVGYSASGVGHVVPQHEVVDLEWFGI